MDENEFDFEKLTDYNDMIEHMEEIARALGLYRKKLEEDYDFTRDEAVMFCLDFHRAYWTGQHNPAVTIIGGDDEHHEEEDDED
jgi:hypothetical protein